MPGWRFESKDCGDSLRHWNHYLLVDEPHHNVWRPFRCTWFCFHSFVTILSTASRPMNKHIRDNIEKCLPYTLRCPSTYVYLRTSTISTPMSNNDSEMRSSPSVVARYLMETTQTFGQMHPTSLCDVGSNE